MKKHCFSLFFVMKKNEKQCFINLITRRSSVQIWLPHSPICTPTSRSQSPLGWA